MSVKPTDGQRSFYHTSYLAGELFNPADRYRLFRERILPKLLKLRAQLDSLYCEENGRPATDPVMLAGVTLLQFMEKLPDRAASEHAVYHLGWKYALDLELTDFVSSLRPSRESFSPRPNGPRLKTRWRVWAADFGGGTAP